MRWEDTIFEFENYLRLEKQLSDNTVDAYKRDVVKLQNYFNNCEHIEIKSIIKEDVQGFIYEIAKNQSQRTQSRLLSSLRAFFLFLELEKIRADNPMELIENPKLGFYLPDVLSLNEVDKMIASIDLSKPILGERNRTILETLYGLGLRVSELINLQLSDIYWKEGFVKVTGKGNKQRLVPLGSTTAKYLDIYMKSVRTCQKIDEKSRNTVFLNRRGKKLSRVMIFNIVKEAAQNADIQKNISPHTLRHSFATHLIENGADLISIQKMLGHESITTTEIYTHLDQKFLYDTMLKHHPRSHESKQ